MNSKITKISIALILGTSILTGCSSKREETKPALAVESNQVQIASQPNPGEIVIQEEATDPSLQIIEYTSDYFSVIYPENIEIKEWDMDDSTTLKLSFNDSRDYINIHYTGDYSYADYCMALADSLSSKNEYYGTNSEIGKNHLSARCFEYKSDDDFRITYHITPARNGALVVEVGNETISHGENSSDSKQLIAELLNSIVINEDYMPSEYDYTSTKIVEALPTSIVQELPEN